MEPFANNPNGPGAVFMRQFMFSIATSLIDARDALEVTATQTNDQVEVFIRAHPSEVGKLIGKQGRTARSLRTIVSAAGTKLGVRVSLDIQSLL